MNQHNLLKDLILRKHKQRENFQKLQINKSNSIVEGNYLKIGGIDQWVTIRGENKDNPVLLLIHGGPASTYSIFSPLLRSWEKHFTLVQWDQRGAGKTFKRNGKESCNSLSLAQLAKDGIELSEYLCRNLGHEKIILIGSSVGSLIGVMMAKYRPDLYYAYVGTDQNAPDPQGLSYQLTMDTLRAAGMKKGLELIERMGSDRSKWSQKDFEKRNQYLVKATQSVPNMIIDLMLPSMLSSPEHKTSDLLDIFKGMSFSLEHLYDELSSFDLKKLGLDFELPFFIFQGDTDILTPTILAKAYFDQINAPFKEFVLIKNAGHLACFARAEQFLEELIKRVKPFADNPVSKDHSSLFMI